MGATYVNAEYYNVLWGSDHSQETLDDYFPDKSVAEFSNRDGEILDVMALGKWITAASGDGQYFVTQGTSMASPYVAGGIALMQQIAEEELGRKLTLAEVEN